MFSYVNITWNNTYQDNAGMISLLGTIVQCLRSGKKQQWHTSSVTNVCVGLLAGLKVLLLFMALILGYVCH